MVDLIAQEHIGVDTIYLQPSKAGSRQAPGQSVNGDTLANSPSPQITST